MAFGIPAHQQENAQRKQTQSTTDTNYVWPFVEPAKNANTGSRKFRIFPSVHSELPEVVGTSEYWVSCTKNGKPHQQRIFVDDLFESPIWERIIKPLREKGGEEKIRYPRQFSAFLVFDLTPVIFDTYGNPLYANQSGEFWTQKPNQLGKQRGDLLGTLEDSDTMPLEEIRVFNHTPKSIGLIADFFEETESPSGKKMNPDEMTITYKVSHRKEEWTRGIYPTTDVRPFSELVKITPDLKVFDIWSWMRVGAWPHEAVEELLNGRDSEEVIEKYDIEPFPVLRSISDIVARQSEREATAKMQVVDDDDIPF
jgi:hypothetical protein